MEARLIRLFAIVSFSLPVAGGWGAQVEADTSGDREARMRKMMAKDDGAPKVGSMAPTFVLKSLDGRQETDLASFRGKKPVVLFFGSYT